MADSIASRRVDTSGSGIFSLTKREWYAGVALQGMLAAYDGVQVFPPEARVTKDAFDYADAMMAAATDGGDAAARGCAVRAAYLALRRAAEELGGTGYFAKAADDLKACFGL